MMWKVLLLMISAEIYLLSGIVFIMNVQHCYVVRTGTSLAGASEHYGISEERSTFFPTREQGSQNLSQPVVPVVSSCRLGVSGSAGGCQGWGASGNGVAVPSEGSQAAGVLVTAPPGTSSATSCSLLHGALAVSISEPVNGGSQRPRGLAELCGVADETT